MTRTFAVRVPWPLEQTGYSAMLHFIRATMQDNRTDSSTPDRVHIPLMAPAPIAQLGRTEQYKRKRTEYA